MRKSILRAFPWIALGAAALVALGAGAEPVFVQARGSVDFNQITTPPLGNAAPADPVEMLFAIDSTIFTDSASFPTRGYAIDPGSFSLTLGAVVIGLEQPFPPGQTPFFVLRDNDPAVDGFFIATSIDFPIGVPLDQTGAFGTFINNFSVTYDGGLLPSLDLLDATGTYDFDQLTVFNWTIDDGPFQPLGINFETLTIQLLFLLFADGFETGDLSGWSSASP